MKPATCSAQQISGAVDVVCCLLSRLKENKKTKKSRCC